MALAEVTEDTDKPDGTLQLALAGGTEPNEVNRLARVTFR